MTNVKLPDTWQFHYHIDIYNVYNKTSFHISLARACKYGANIVVPAICRESIAGSPEKNHPLNAGNFTTDIVNMKHTRQGKKKKAAAIEDKIEHNCHLQYRDPPYDTISQTVNNEKTSRQNTDQIKPLRFSKGSMAFSPSN